MVWGALTTCVAVCVLVPQLDDLVAWSYEGDFDRLSNNTITICSLLLLV